MSKHRVQSQVSHAAPSWLRQTPDPSDLAALEMLFSQARYAEMERVAGDLTQSFPQLGIAWKAMGIAVVMQGRIEQACAHLHKAALLMPRDADVHNSLGNVLHAQARLVEAAACYRQALQIQPGFAEAHYNLGNVLKEQGHRADAQASLRRALFFKPRHAEAHDNLGVLLMEQGDHLAAEVCHRMALDCNPKLVTAHNNLGVVLKRQGRHDEAQSCFRRALELQPTFAQTHYNLACLCKEQGRLPEAQSSFRSAVVLKPDYADAHRSLGLLFLEQGQLTEAEGSLRVALKLNPDCADAHYNLGVVFMEQGELFAAEASYRLALKVNPGLVEAHCNLGVVLKEQGRLTEADECYRNALHLDPACAAARCNVIFTMNYSLQYEQSACFDQARQHGELVTSRVREPISSWRCTPQPGRLRIGLVSGDLKNHPVGYFIEALLAHLDREQIEVVVYANQSACDDVAARIQQQVSLWRSLVGVSDESAAKIILNDEVHVLIDLAGYTASNRLPIFAWKPAPVQVTWLGYFATTGLSAMDYILGDPHVTPPNENGHFTESVWRLPQSYLCFTPPNEALLIGPLPALLSGGITFGSFNHLTKMNDAVVSLWARVLRAVPSARLLLKTRQLNDSALCERTRHRFAAHGISCERLLLEGSSPRVDLLAAYHRVDIALDPFPYTGGTTSVEGLWMGVPIVTRKGDRFLSHVGESIAHNAGLENWIAADDDDYVAKAVAGASNLESLATLRAGLRQQLVASPLCDAQRFARHFEAALWGMWKTHRGNSL